MNVLFTSTLILFITSLIHLSFSETQANNVFEAKRLDFGNKFKQKIFNEKDELKSFDRRQINKINYQILLIRNEKVTQKVWISNSMASLIDTA
ncbi:hypothetical protein BpHYR1_019402 [Brachionus plicatilis]|uniref:Uncharacterized protein n=1 Tax=Brachionus plicatilis TaxID=10195 RepID=A0A3M7SPN5_BRAPC|nr:hypothetical protein BpHYR1_019402 [Brachionus plicatilis]